MAEIDEKTRDALSQLAGEEYCGNCGFYHGSFEKLAGVIQQQLQQLADLKAALEWASENAFIEPNYVRVARANWSTYDMHREPMESVASMLIRAHKEATGG